MEEFPCLSRHRGTFCSMRSAGANKRETCVCCHSSSNILFDIKAICSERNYYQLKNVPNLGTLFFLTKKKLLLSVKSVMGTTINTFSISLST